MTVTGDKEVMANLRAFAQKAPRTVGEALYRVGEEVMNESKRECPVDTGELRGTGRVEGPNYPAGDIAVELKYSADYAFWVHERLDLAHVSPTKAKYLEDPVNRHASEIPALIEKNIGRIL